MSVSAVRPRYGGSTTAVGSARSCASRSSRRLDRAASSVINSASLSRRRFCSYGLALGPPALKCSVHSDELAFKCRYLSGLCSRQPSLKIVAASVNGGMQCRAKRLELYLGGCCTLAQGTQGGSYGSPEVAQERVDPSGCRDRRFNPLRRKSLFVGSKCEGLA